MRDGDNGWPLTGTLVMRRRGRRLVTPASFVAQFLHLDWMGDLAALLAESELVDQPRLLRLVVGGEGGEKALDSAGNGVVALAERLQDGAEPVLRRLDDVLDDLVVFIVGHFREG